MTATGTAPAPATTDTWNQQLAQLKIRYKHVREPVLVALNILMHDQNIAVEDAKAQATLHGVRITVASVNAAKTLLSRMDSAPATKALAGANTVGASASPATAAQARVRRTRAEQPTLDTEALVRGVVAKIQGQGNAKAERLREVMRKVIATLQAAVG